MVEHPCINGLSPACFKFFPDWVKQALAYKLLNVILPKKILPLLMAGLESPLIGPGSTLPGGVELPPGSIVPPDFSVPENWIPWFNFIFTTPEDPRTLFPVDWSPGNTLPPGVKLPEGFVLPPNWIPVDPPNPFYLPGYNPFPTPSESGAVPPLFVQGWEPGPPRITGGVIQAPKKFERLMGFDGPGDYGVDFGHDSNWKRISTRLPILDSYYITKVRIKIGKFGFPMDGVQVLIQGTLGGYLPNDLDIIGSSNIILPYELPEFSVSQNFIDFIFADQPLLTNFMDYAIVILRTGEIAIDDFYKVLGAGFSPGYVYRRDYNEIWVTADIDLIEYEVWGILF